MAANPSQLFLLSDHIKLSLLERQRARSLELEPNSQNAEISRSLDALREGLESVERQQAESPSSATDSARDSARRLRTQYADLLHQFDGSTASASPSAAATLTSPNDARLSADFAHAQQPRPPKSVRFTDTDTDAAADPTARATLFPYRDDPADDDQPPDHTALSNDQVHTYHTHVLQEQDEQLDRLGVSIGRQRELSIQIGDELDEQAELLDDVDEGVERHQTQLGRAKDRLGKVARKAKDNLSMTIILILIVVLVLLIVLLKGR